MISRNAVIVGSRTRWPIDYTRGVCKYAHGAMVRRRKQHASPCDDFDLLEDWMIGYREGE